MSARWQNRIAAERWDILEPPLPARGCNAHSDNGERCGRLVEKVYGGKWGERRLCRAHRDLYVQHDWIVKRILSL